MDLVLWRTFTIIFSVEFIIGTLGNGFIVLMKCTDWIKGSKLSFVDQILIGLAISRTGLIWLIFLDWWLFMLYPILHMTEKMLRMYYISWTVLNHLNLWLTASLSIFYFLKIANFYKTIFLYLKFRVKKVIAVTLLVSLLILILNIIIIKIYVDMCIVGAQRNVSYTSSMNNYEQSCKLLAFTNPMFTLIPFGMSLTTLLLLIFSLWKHLKNIQHSMKDSRDISSKAHIKALQTVIVSVLLYSIFFLSFFMKVWGKSWKDKYFFSLCAWALGIAVLSGHSFVLIQGNNRLRWAWRSVMLWFRCRFKSAEP
uniref:Taste receptor type 2 n=1 Tax=Nannospalax galili TaxID=1026970 RepID=A0A7S5W9P0_NANGA|nr:taste receptor type 2 member 113 [Nannospalax galili]QKE46721.1 taste receptor type 2 member 113 [Nannospalax galili]QKE46723.1 taste receptor type 2 member 113 [Nannospalax galili]QKE46731.1 taste receptor type 2 member 113 [Nannospalax galili]